MHGSKCRLALLGRSLVVVGSRVARLFMSILFSLLLLFCLVFKKRLEPLGVTISEIVSPTTPVRTFGTPVLLPSTVVDPCVRLSLFMLGAVHLTWCAGS